MCYSDIVKVIVSLTKKRKSYDIFLPFKKKMLSLHQIKGGIYYENYSYFPCFHLFISFSIDARGMSGPVENSLVRYENNHIVVYPERGDQSYHPIWL